jgi:hypothetical protein
VRMRLEKLVALQRLLQPAGGELRPCVKEGTGYNPLHSPILNQCVSERLFPFPGFDSLVSAHDSDNWSDTRVTGARWKVARD